MKNKNRITLITIILIIIILIGIMVNTKVQNSTKIENEKAKLNITNGTVEIKTKVEERLENGDAYILVTIESEEGIEKVSFPDDNGNENDIELIVNRNIVAKDLKIHLNVSYPITITKTNGEIIKEIISLNGNGTKEYPIIIRTPDELQAVNDDLSAYYKLGANIDLTNYEFTPIGTSENPFVGNIDGTGYTISNLNIEDEEGENVGLFGYSNGTISNITLENVTVKGKTNVGGLLGYNIGIVTNCKVRGNIIGEGDNVGGLIGYVYLANKSTTLSNNIFEGKVTGINQVGGLIGQYHVAASSLGEYNIYVQESYATGDVEGINNVGGLIGYQYVQQLGCAYSGQGTNSIVGYVDQCYAIGNVKSTENNAGGLIGYVYAYSSSDSAAGWADRANTTIQNSFATGKVEGKSNIGGLVGYGYRECKYSDYQNSGSGAWIQIINTYAIGEVLTTVELGQTGGLIATIATFGRGGATATDSYWASETTKQEEGVLGTENIISYMLHKVGYSTTWDFDTIWKVEEGETVAYLRNMDKPESVNKGNITFEEFEVEGEGTEESPFIIKTPIQLQKISKKLNAHYKLGANIDLTNYGFTSIGRIANPFVGNIDGTGYTISNLNIENEEGENVGLFGYSNGTISNITLENMEIKGKTNVGGLVGYNIGTVTESKIKGNVTGTGDNVGGLVGYNTGTVTESKIKGNVTGTGDNVGGLIGYNNGTVTNSQTEGTVIGRGNNIGGLIGQTNSGIEENISKANVEGKENTGGLVGYVYASAKEITLNNNIAKGKIKGTNQVGGLIGNSYAYEINMWYTAAINIQKSYATGDVEGVNQVGGLIGSQIAETRYYRISTENRIQESYATGNVIAIGQNIGGLIGQICSYNVNMATDYAATANCIIQNSYAIGKVEGINNVGGLVGEIYRSSYQYGAGYVSITNTYAIGEVIGEEVVGGLIGITSGFGPGNTTVTDSYWNTETTKQESSVLGTASNTTNMTRTELYINWPTDKWIIEDGKYPKINF